VSNIFSYFLEGRTLNLFLFRSFAALNSLRQDIEDASLAYYKRNDSSCGLLIMLISYIYDIQRNNSHIRELTS